MQKCAPYEETEENENRKSMQEKRALNCFLRREEAYFRTISNSQIVYSIQAVNYIYHKDYNKALYYFAKCVEDEGTGLNKKKCISVSEYAIYFNITYLFFMIIEQ